MPKAVEFQPIRIHYPHSESLDVGLFAEGTISLAKAARLAGMTRYEFAALLKTQALLAYEYTQEEYREDLDFLASAHE